jgi:ArsR family metal-binding transcriptional regulator
MMRKNKSERVIIATGIIVAVPEDEDEAFNITEELSDRIRHVIKHEFSKESNISFNGVVDFYWLDRDDQNWGECSECGSLITNCKKPNMIPTLPIGEIVEDKFMCDQCMRGEFKP